MFGRAWSWEVFNLEDENSGAGERNRPGSMNAGYTTVTGGFSSATQGTQCHRGFPALGRCTLAQPELVQYLEACNGGLKSTG